MKRFLKILTFTTIFLFLANNLAWANIHTKENGKWSSLNGLKNVHSHLMRNGHIVRLEFKKPVGDWIEPVFNEKSVQLTGTSFLVLEDVRSVFLGAHLSYSLNGNLIYLPGVDQQIVTPMWVDKNGVEQETTLEPKVYGNFRVSPDGSRIGKIFARF